MLLGACGGSSTAPPAYYGSLDISVPSIPATLNPMVSVGDRSVTRLIDSLLLPRAFYVDSNSNFVLDTRYVLSAETISVNPQVVVYKINQKAIWSDGHPLSALDFIYTWEALDNGLEGKVLPYASELVDTSGYSDISSLVSNSDGSEVTVTFKHPMTDWRSLFSTIYPARYMHLQGFIAGLSFGVTALPSITNYLIKSYTTHNIVLASSKPSNFSSITFSDGTATAASLHATIGQPGSFAPANAATSGFIQGSSVTSLIFNTTNTSLALRNGLAYSIDRSVLWSNIFGKTPLANYPSPPPGNNLYTNSEQGYEDHQGFFLVGDFAKAIRSFVLAGMTYDQLGYLTSPTGPVQISLAYDASSPVDTRSAQLIDKIWSYFGFSVQLHPYSSTSSPQALIDSGQYTAVIWDIPATPEPSDRLNVIEHQLNGADPSTFGALTSSQIDQASNQVYPIDASKLYNAVDSQIWLNMVELPLFQVPQPVWFDHQVGTTALSVILPIVTGGTFNASTFLTPAN
ncbi:MAG: ABC transporter substrate-binding protein [Actinomycetota bacterium]|nr:ABC transporter substrate-binding protein [Actinomycetota bacterium]